MTGGGLPQQLGAPATQQQQQQVLCPLHPSEPQLLLMDTWPSGLLEELEAAAGGAGQEGPQPRPPQHHVGAVLLRAAPGSPLPAHWGRAGGAGGGSGLQGTLSGDLSLLLGSDGSEGLACGLLGSGGATHSSWQPRESGAGATPGQPLSQGQQLMGQQALQASQQGRSQDGSSQHIDTVAVLQAATQQQQKQQLSHKLQQVQAMGSAQQLQQQQVVIPAAPEAQQPSLQQQLEQLLAQHPALRQALAAQAGLVSSMPPPPPAAAPAQDGSNVHQVPPASGPAPPVPQRAASAACGQASTAPATGNQTWQKANAHGDTQVQMQQAVQQQQQHHHQQQQQADARVHSSAPSASQVSERPAPAPSAAPRHRNKRRNARPTAAERYKWNGGAPVAAVPAAQQAAPQLRRLIGCAGYLDRLHLPREDVVGVLPDSGVTEDTWLAAVEQVKARGGGGVVVFAREVQVVDVDGSNATWTVRYEGIVSNGGRRALRLAGSWRSATTALGIQVGDEVVLGPLLPPLRGQGSSPRLPIRVVRAPGRQAPAAAAAAATQQGPSGAASASAGAPQPSQQQQQKQHRQRKTLQQQGNRGEEAHAQNQHVSEQPPPPRRHRRRRRDDDDEEWQADMNDAHMADACEHVSDSDGTSQPTPCRRARPSRPAPSGCSSGGQRGSSPMPGPAGAGVSAGRGLGGAAGREDSPAKRLKLSQLQLAGDSPSPRSCGSGEVVQPPGLQRGSCGSGQGSRASRAGGASQAQGLSRLASMVTADGEAPAGASPRTSGSQQQQQLGGSAQAAPRPSAAPAPTSQRPSPPASQPPHNQQQQAASGEQQASAEAAAHCRRSATPMDASTGPAASMVHHLSASMGGLPLGMAALGGGGTCLFPPGLMLASTNCLFQSMGGGMVPGGEGAAGGAGPLAALMPTGAVLLCVAPMSSMLTLGLQGGQQLALPGAHPPLSLPADPSTAVAGGGGGARQVPHPAMSPAPGVTGAAPAAGSGLSSGREGTSSASRGEQQGLQRQQQRQRDSMPQPQLQPVQRNSAAGPTQHQQQQQQEAAGDVGRVGASRTAAEAALDAAVAALPPNASGAQLVSHAAAIAAAVAANSCGRRLPLGYPRLDGAGVEGASGSGGNTTHGGQRASSGEGSQCGPAPGSAAPSGPPAPRPGANSPDASCWSSCGSPFATPTRAPQAAGGQPQPPGHPPRSRMAGGQEPAPLALPRGGQRTGRGSNGAGAPAPMLTTVSSEGAQQRGRPAAAAMAMTRQRSAPAAGRASGSGLAAGGSGLPARQDYQGRIYHTTALLAQQQQQHHHHQQQQQQLQAAGGGQAAGGVVGHGAGRPSPQPATGAAAFAAIHAAVIGHGMLAGQQQQQQQDQASPMEVQDPSRPQAPRLHYQQQQWGRDPGQYTEPVGLGQGQLPVPVGRAASAGSTLPQQMGPGVEGAPRMGASSLSGGGSGSESWMRFPPRGLPQQGSEPSTAPASPALCSGAAAGQPQDGSGSAGAPPASGAAELFKALDALGRMRPDLLHTVAQALSKSKQPIAPAAAAAAAPPSSRPGGAGELGSGRAHLGSTVRLPAGGERPQGPALIGAGWQGPPPSFRQPLPPHSMPAAAAAAAGHGGPLFANPHSLPMLQPPPPVRPAAAQRGAGGGTKGRAKRAGGAAAAQAGPSRMGAPVQHGLLPPGGVLHPGAAVGGSVASDAWQLGAEAPPMGGVHLPLLSDEAQQQLLALLAGCPSDSDGLLNLDGVPAPPPAPPASGAPAAGAMGPPRLPAASGGGPGLTPTGVLMASSRPDQMAAGAAGGSGRAAMDSCEDGASGLLPAWPEGEALPDLPGGSACEEEGQGGLPWWWRRRMSSMSGAWPAGLGARRHSSNSGLLLSSLPSGDWAMAGEGGPDTWLG